MSKDDDDPILVVDDDPHLREALAAILEQEGFRVLQAPDGETAVRMTAAQRPGLLVVDYMMPGMNGEMVLDALRQEHGVDTPPALLLTAADGPLARARTSQGAVFGLEKPFAVRDLLEAVNRHRRRLTREAS